LAVGFWLLPFGCVGVRVGSCAPSELYRSCLTYLSYRHYVLAGLKNGDLTSHFHRKDVPTRLEKQDLTFHPYGHNTPARVENEDSTIHSHRQDIPTKPGKNN